MVTVSLLYPCEIGVVESEIFPAFQKCVGCHTKYAQEERYWPKG